MSEYDEWPHPCDADYPAVVAAVLKSQDQINRGEIIWDESDEDEYEGPGWLPPENEGWVLND